ncbi:MAG TPA: hypothetical protein VE326_14915 [Candidatus Binatia bacterium]|nr:hypothetical protein [Candidatus Binatia bacterium]
MHRHTVLFAALLSTLVVGVRPANSLCNLSSFEQRLEWADIIFVGTVDDRTCIKVPGSIGTRYRFRDVRFIKGTGVSDSLILIQSGGTIRGMTIWSEGEPSFQVGTRYILPATRHCPAPAFCAPPCSFGFIVASDSASAIPVVRASGSQLMVFDDRHMIWVSDRPWKPRDLLPSFDQVVLGDKSPNPPPRRPLAETVRLADSADAALRVTLRETVSESDLARDQMITVALYPHQDSGDRVTEEQFATVMKRILTRLSHLAPPEHPEGK